MDLIFGFGICCSCPKSEVCDYIRPLEVFRSSDTLFIKTEDGKTISSDKHFFYSLKEDEIWVKRTLQINSYGRVVGKSLEISKKEQ